MYYYVLDRSDVEIEIRLWEFHQVETGGTKRTSYCSYREGFQKHGRVGRRTLCEKVYLDVLNKSKTYSRIFKNFIVEGNTTCVSDEI